MTEPTATQVCPLCGGPNACALASCTGGKRVEDCWCAKVSFDPALLARVPEAQREKCCICAQCAGGEEKV